VASLVFVLIWLARFGPNGVAWLQRRRAHSWPWAETMIEGGTVKPVGEGRSRVYRLTVGYSYSIRGEKYGGAYSEPFSSESEAKALLESLRVLPPPARYKPSDPCESVMDPYRDAALAVVSHGSENASS
jgi:hypothetical protein